MTPLLRDGTPSKPLPDLAHLFHGHGIVEGGFFGVSSDDWSVRIEVGSMATADTPRLTQASDPAHAFALKRVIRKPDSIRVPGWMLVSEEGGFLIDLRQDSEPEAPRNSLVGFLGTDALRADQLAPMWNTALTAGRKAEVRNALQIIEPSFDDLDFMPGATPGHYTGRAVMGVAYKGDNRRYPLGSAGEGMTRMLVLALGLIQSSEGKLLVDEIDTGLHYSILGDMWKMVVETAVKHDVQVFATTHSFDCIRGLAWLCESFPELGKEVSLQKIEPTLEHSVALTPKQLVLAVEQGIEVR